ncbi:hypothetical protein H0H93_008046 [Arthromyces matolae]|nr:hypothetical protein H0H93_008046 [Arthromyces matolae]
MLARLSAIFLLALPAFAAPGSYNAPASSTLAGLLGVAVGSVGIQLGLDCTPVGVAGGAGQECNGQAACCASTNENGVATLGCMPFNINL